MLVNDAFFKEQELPFSDESDFQIYDDHEPDNEEHDDLADYCSICSTIHDYNRLTYEMIEEIKFLRAEVVRWRQALIKFLSPRWAEGLKQDIYNNIFQCFEDLDAYKYYVNNCCNGIDPLDNKEQSAFLARLKNGTDETSITHLE